MQYLSDQVKTITKEQWRATNLMWPKGTRLDFDKNDFSIDKMHKQDYFVSDEDFPGCRTNIKAKDARDQITFNIALPRLDVYLTFAQIQKHKQLLDKLTGIGIDIFSRESSNWLFSRPVNFQMSSLMSFQLLRTSLINQELENKMALSPSSLATSTLM